MDVQGQDSRAGLVLVTNAVGQWSRPAAPAQFESYRELEREAGHDTPSTNRVVQFSYRQW